MTLFLSVLRAVAAWTFTAAFLSVFAPVQLLTFRRLPGEWVRRLIQWWAKTTLRLLGIRLEVLNESTMEARASRVFVFNHQSALDVLWMAAVCPPAPLAIGKKQLVWIPFINLGWWAMDYLYIDRHNPRKALGTLKKAAREVVERQRTLMIAPEGTRTPDGTILPFKRGAFKFAVETQATICPLVVTGAFELLPKQKFLPKTGVIRLSFLPPVETKGLGPADVEGLLRRVRDSICAAFETQSRCQS